MGGAYSHNPPPAKEEHDEAEADDEEAEDHQYLRARREYTAICAAQQLLFSFEFFSFAFFLPARSVEKKEIKIKIKER